MKTKIVNHNQKGWLNILLVFAIVILTSCYSSKKTVQTLAKTQTNQDSTIVQTADSTLALASDSNSVVVPDSTFTIVPTSIFIPTSTVVVPDSNLQLRSTIPQKNFDYNRSFNWANIDTATRNNLKLWRIARIVNVDKTSICLKYEIKNFNNDNQTLAWFQIEKKDGDIKNIVTEPNNIIIITK